MIWAQWGLKDRLMADPNVWLCHQCNDCSTKCPRGARPGDVLAALRHESVLHYAVPRFLAQWANQMKFLPLMLLIPAVLLGLALLVRGPIEGILPFGDDHGEVGGEAGAVEHLEGPGDEALAEGEEFPHGFYAAFFPHWLLIGFFSGFSGLAALAAVVGVMRFWLAMKTADKASGRSSPARGIVAGMVGTVKSILFHDKFGQCTSHASRRSAHLLAFYGFMALFVVTVWAVIDLYVMPNVFRISSMYPFDLLHPMKVVANVGCVILIFGCVTAIVDRRRSQEEAAASTSFDWIFVWLLLSVGVSGLLTEICRFAFEQAGIDGLTYLAYAVYFVHLVLVFDLLVYLPYSKFAHIMYRTVALVYAEHTGRNEVAAENA